MYMYDIIFQNPKEWYKYEMYTKLYNFEKNIFALNH